MFETQMYYTWYFVLEAPDDGLMQSETSNHAKNISSV